MEFVEDEQQATNQDLKDILGDIFAELDTDKCERRHTDKWIQDGINFVYEKL